MTNTRTTTDLLSRFNCQVEQLLLADCYSSISRESLADELEDIATSIRIGIAEEN
tara:strand:- start:413 stop:577 length:165 start_codon:yes stop_codon:yes gene_type:complete